MKNLINSILNTQLRLNQTRTLGHMWSINVLYLHLFILDLIGHILKAGKFPMNPVSSATTMDKNVLHMSTTWIILSWTKFEQLSFVAENCKKQVTTIWVPVPFVLEKHLVVIGHRWNILSKQGIWSDCIM